MARPSLELLNNELIVNSSDHMIREIKSSECQALNLRPRETTLQWKPLKRLIIAEVETGIQQAIFK